MIRPPQISNAPKILCITPTRLFKRALCRAFTEHDERLVFRQAPSICDAFEWTTSGDIGVLGPIIGAPAVTLACEAFIHSGTSTFALLGAIGGISSKDNPIAHGQVIFPRKLLSQEGTSTLYGAPPSSDSPPGELQIRMEEHFRSLSTSFLESHPEDNSSFESTCGMICSTDAPMMESEEVIERLRSQGVCAVDMEYTAVQHLCMLRNVPLVAGFAVSDVFEHSWSPGFSKLKQSKAVSLLCSSYAQTLIEALSEEGSKV